MTATSSDVTAAETDGVVASTQTKQRSRGTWLFFVVSAGLVVIGFLALGVWQVQRLAWKTALIARVDARVHRLPVSAPETARWSQVSAETDAYSHVKVKGFFLDKLTTRVQAVTESGAGSWLLTPLCRTDGSIVLINRGFIAAGPQALGDVAAMVPVSAHVDACTSVKTDDTVIREVTGLLRINEAGGAFLRNNNALTNRWYSRDVLAIAAARGLPVVAPYFIDADAGQETILAAPSGRPVSGLTVIVFHNSHLVYAFTWFALAFMAMGGFYWVVREERHAR